MSAQLGAFPEGKVFRQVNAIDAFSTPKGSLWLCYHGIMEHVPTMKRFEVGLVNSDFFNQNFTETFSLFAQSDEITSIT